MSSLSMATAVWARNCAGAAASNEAMPIAATVKYSLALSLMGALLVHVIFVPSRVGHVCSPHALRAQAKILHSPCRPAISLVEPGFSNAGAVFGFADGTPSRSGRWPVASEEGAAADIPQRKRTNRRSHPHEQILDRRRGGGATDRYDRARLRAK